MMPSREHLLERLFLLVPLPLLAFLDAGELASDGLVVLGKRAGF